MEANIRNPKVVACITIFVLVILLSILFLLPSIDQWFYSQVDFRPGSSSEFNLHDETEKHRELYNQWVYSENRRMFQWHFRSTKIIFWVSMFITITGVSFAFWQFVEASRTERKFTEENELQVKTQFISLAFKSRSLATFMMSVSLAYLLIYVTFVYPIKPVLNGEGFSSEVIDSITEEDFQTATDNSLESKVQEDK